MSIFLDDDSVFRFIIVNDGYVCLSLWGVAHACRGPLRSEEGIRSSGARVIGIYEPPDLF